MCYHLVTVAEKFYPVCPNVGDGNPLSTESARALLVQAGADVSPTDWLNVTSRPAAAFHRGMTTDPGVSAEYTEGSEAARQGFKARAYSQLSFAEMVLHMVPHESGDIALLAGQEHPVMRASPKLLKNLGVKCVYLLVADSFPKESSIAATRHLDSNGIDAYEVVWNELAHAELLYSDVPSLLVEPYIYRGLKAIAGDEAGEGSTDIVMKTSGSGIPEEWKWDITTQLSKAGTPFSYLEPGNNSRRTLHQRQIKLGRALSNTTQLIIGFPSELVQMTAGIQLNGGRAGLLALPPRGVHEARNLEFAKELGILKGSLHPEDLSVLTVDGECMTIKDFVGTLGSQPEPELTVDLLGTQPLEVALSPSAHQKISMDE